MEILYIAEALNWVGSGIRKDYVFGDIKSKLQKKEKKMWVKLAPNNYDNGVCIS